MSTQTYAGYSPAASPLGGLFNIADIPEDADSVFDDEPEGADFSTQNGAAPPEFQGKAEFPANAPQAPKVGASMRPYQERAVKSALHALNPKGGGHEGALIVAATGTGKSLVLAELNRRLCDDWGHGVLNLCHRDELIRQMARACDRLGVHALIEKADERALEGFGLLSRCVVGSIQTMAGKRLESWPRDAFRAIIVDEAHHAVSPSFGRLFAHFHKARRIGLTATADRMDGKSLGKVFPHLAFEYNLRAAIEDGWLVPPRAIQLKTDPPIDLRALRVTGGGDFRQDELEKIVNENIGVLVNAIVDVNALESRRTLAFTPDVASANALACALNDVGISARAVSGISSDRAQILRSHQNGEFQVLCNCALLTEGYDDPAVSCVLICRPTRSRGLYSQMVGRATRLHPESGKVDCLVVDFAFVTAEHDLVSPVDLLDNSEEPDEVIAIARDLIKTGREDSLKLAIDEARAQFETARRVRIQRRAVQVKAGKFDLTTVCDLFGIAPQKEAYEFADYEAASQKQVDLLAKFGVEIPPDCGKGTATKLIGKLFARKDHGWANPWQIRDLMQVGIAPEAALSMREAEAKSYLDANPVLATDKQVGLLVGKFGWHRDEARCLTKKEAIAAINKASAGAA